MGIGDLPARHPRRVAVVLIASAVVVVSSIAYAATASSNGSQQALGSALPPMLPASDGRTYYVDGARGHDRGRGTLRRPWRTIGYALARVPVRGSVVQVRAGTYEGVVKIDRNGNPSDPITLEAYPGEHVVLTGPPHTLWPTVWITGGGIRLHGFDITGPTNNAGIRVENAHDVEVSGCDIHDTGHGGLITTGTATHGLTGNRNIQLLGNRFHDNGGGWRTTDAYSIRGDHSVYWGATVSNTDGIDHSTQGGVIADNLFYDQPYGRQLQIGSQVKGLIVTNNTFYRATQPDFRAGNAIQVYAEDNPFATQDVLIVNNVITYAAHYGVYGSYGNDRMSSNVVRNNFAYGNHDGDFLDYYGDPSKVLFTLGENYTGRPPRFVSPARGDFQLQWSSPAIGKAIPEYAPPVDFYGRPRVPHPDLGAIQTPPRPRSRSSA